MRFPWFTTWTLEFEMDGQRFESSKETIKYGDSCKYMLCPAQRRNQSTLGSTRFAGTS